MSTPAQSEEQRLQEVTAEERTVEVSQTLSDATDPQALLDRTKATRELETLQLQQVADLIRALEKIYRSKLDELERVIASVKTLLEQTAQLHEMMLRDAETELEILKTFQSQIVIVEPVKRAGTQTGARIPGSQESN